MMAIRCFKLAGLYLIAGMSLGAAMGATHQFALAPVHAHLNLLGWTLLALIGLILARFPHLGETRLALAFFWVYNLSLPPSMALLAGLQSGYTELEPALGITSSGMWLGGLLWVLNLLLNLQPAHLAQSRSA